MIDPTQNIKNLAEIELLRVEMEARRLGARIVWVALGGLAAALGVIMLSLTAFFALAEVYGTTWGALLTAGGLFGLCAIAFLIANKPPGRAARLETEVIEQKIARARADVRHDIGRIERQLDQLTMGLLSLLKGSTANLPMVTLILGLLATLSPVLRRLIAPLLKRE